MCSFDLQARAPQMSSLSSSTWQSTGADTHQQATQNDEPTLCKPRDLLDVFENALALRALRRLHA